MVCGRFYDTDDWILQTNPNQMMVTYSNRLYTIDLSEAWQIVSNVEIKDYKKLDCLKTPGFDPVKKPYFFTNFNPDTRKFNDLCLINSQTGHYRVLIKNIGPRVKF